MWKTLYVATTPEEARVITKALDEQNITYQVESGLAPDSVTILVRESDFHAAEALLREPQQPAHQEHTKATASGLLCVRCSVPLRYKGKRSIQVGFWATGYMDVEAYVCPRCGRIELFEPIFLSEYGVPDQPQEEESLREPSPAAESEEDAYDTLCRKASQLIEQGQLSEAISVYEEIAQKFAHISGAVEAVQRCIAILRERLAKTEAQGEETRASFPSEEESLPQGSKERYEALRRKAKQLRQSGQWQAAIEVYQQIMREFPNDLKAWEEADRNVRELQERLNQ